MIKDKHREKVDINKTHAKCVTVKTASQDTTQEVCEGHRGGLHQCGIQTRAPDAGTTQINFNTHTDTHT